MDVVLTVRLKIASDYIREEVESATLKSVATAPVLYRVAVSLEFAPPWYRVPTMGEAVFTTELPVLPESGRYGSRTVPSVCALEAVATAPEPYRVAVA